MLTIARFVGKMWYDTACIAVGTVIMWRNELKDLHLRGWFDPEATFLSADWADMNLD